MSSNTYQKFCQDLEVVSDFIGGHLSHLLLHVLYSAGREGLVVPTAVAEGAGNGISGYHITLSQGEDTLQGDRGGGGEGRGQIEKEGERGREDKGGGEVDKEKEKVILSFSPSSRMHPMGIQSSNNMIRSIHFFPPSIKTLQCQQADSTHTHRHTILLSTSAAKVGTDTV